MNKAIFCDLDKSLFDNNRNFSPLTLETINLIQAKGIPFIPSTARAAKNAIEVARQLNVDKYGGFMLYQTMVVAFIHLKQIVFY
ncbi:HAD family hydrolase [Spiroplasma endosymbiont of Seladonia tumulorum]|uniref:HAD family hydrolase n=1 Tax=Spiroplasma endosymbiont of Seladonia tumulorum TaxID=3066321 RepID=UPI0030CC0F67